jgi:hypothetical protein
MTPTKTSTETPAETTPAETPTETPIETPIEIFREEKHTIIILHYCSTLPQNLKSPLRRPGDRKACYDFTVKQRMLAKGAKTAKTIEELEGLVRLSFCYLFPG